MTVRVRYGDANGLNSLEILYKGLYLIRPLHRPTLEKSTVFLTNLDRLRHRTVPSPSPYRPPTVPHRTSPYSTVPKRTHRFLRFLAVRFTLFNTYKSVTSKILQDALNKT